MDLQKRHYAILESLGIRAPRLNMLMKLESW